VLHDVGGQAFARLGIESTAQYLIRPDGYIAYRRGGPTLNGLERYLGRWLRGAGNRLDGREQRESRVEPTFRRSNPGSKRANV
jgi:hypothetical protein